MTSLTDLIPQLAHWRQEEAAAQRAMADLANAEPAVSAYLEAEKAARDARQQERDLYQQTCAAALAEFDGEDRRPHPAVEITSSRQAAIRDARAAMLWLLCHAAHTLDLDDARQMGHTLRTVGKALPVSLRKSHEQAAVDELFQAVTHRVSGAIVLTNAQGQEQQRPAGGVSQTAATPEVALAEFEAHLTALCAESGAAWRWAAPPEVRREQRALDQLIVAEPVTVHKPRIRQDLSDYLEESA